MTWQEALARLRTALPFFLIHFGCLRLATLNDDLRFRTIAHGLAPASLSLLDHGDSSGLLPLVGNRRTVTTLRSVRVPAMTHDGVSGRTPVVILTDIRADGYVGTRAGRLVDNLRRSATSTSTQSSASNDSAGCCVRLRQPSVSRESGQHAGRLLTRREGGVNIWIWIQIQV